MKNFSDYIVYVDESGDHSLNCDTQYPVFCLAFCIFEISNYVKSITPALNTLKKRYWGHCDVVLHEHDLRKNRYGDWSILNKPDIREKFLTDVSKLMETSSFHIIASVIKKQNIMQSSSSNTANPYKLAMKFCMKTLNKWLLQNKQQQKIQHVHFEARGRKEDRMLESEFQRICNNELMSGNLATDFTKINYYIRFLDKKANTPGLQLADLVARPIGLHILRPDQKNRAFDVIKNKFIFHDGRNSIEKVNIFP